MINQSIMYIHDKITQKGEIKETGKFELKDNPFYVFLFPKPGYENVSCYILEASLSDEKRASLSECPVSTRCWTPVSFACLNVYQEDFDAFRIFWGTEG